MTVPTSEIGYAKGGLATWAVLGTDVEEQNPDMQHPKSLAVFERMRTEDAQVASVIAAVVLPMISTSWSLDPTGVREEVIQVVAADLDLPIKGRDPEPVARRSRGRFSWHSHMELAFLEVVFGHSYFEQNYEIVDGLARLKKLAWRPHGTIAKFNVAPDGGLESIEQHPSAGKKSRPIPVSQLVAYVHKREGGNWVGRSMLRAAYKNWLLKDRLIRSQALTVDRNGLGVPIYEAAPLPDGISDAADIDSWARNERTEGLKLAVTFRSGETAGASIPSGAKLTLRGVEGTLPDADVPIRYHDEQIARSALAHFLNLGTQTGSWALGSTLGDFFSDSLNAEATHFCDVTQQHVIDDLVDLNWGPNEPAPQLVFDKIGSKSPATAEAIKSLVDAGVITPDAKLEEFIRQVLGMPVMADEVKGKSDKVASEAATVSQKVYLAVANKVISRTEGRRLIERAGAELDEDFIDETTPEESS